LGLLLFPFSYSTTVRPIIPQRILDRIHNGRDLRHDLAVVVTFEHSLNGHRRHLISAKYVAQDIVDYSQ